jgi:mono/diheme cytochrome c family protein
MRGARVFVLPLLILSMGAAFAASPAQQNTFRGGVAANGRAIAMTWCSACHLVGPAAGAAVRADVPTFSSIAQRLDMDADVLAAFIANPHPPMPNLGLSRQDIRDLLAYIATLR